MKVAGSFFRLIRWPNLLFIVLTQVLFYYAVILPVLPDSYYSFTDKLTGPVFAVLVLASVLIAAAGYIINDYFDINIDRVNKPDKMIIERVIKRRWAIILHIILTLTGIVLSLYVSLKTSLVIVFANIGCALLLWVYSTTFKKKLLSGNVIISALTAWVLIVLYFAVNTVYLGIATQPGDILKAMNTIFKYGVLYAGFAFIISLVREVVKDMEDMEGDARYGCKTMPIVWGVPASKVFVAVWIVVLICAISIMIIYMLQKGWWIFAVYSLLLLVLPLGLLLKQFHAAQQPSAYHAISTRIKMVMFAGILSMLLLKLYF